MFNKNVFVFVALIGILLVAGCTKIKGGKTAVEIPKFSSCNEIANAFKSASSGYDYGVMYESVGSPMPTAMPTAAKSDSGSSAPSYSTTNVQVQGVDEADIVKTDGRYIYTISNGKLHIAEAYPADTAKVLSSTKLTYMNPNEIFIDVDIVFIFGRLGVSYYEFSSIYFRVYIYK